MENNQLIKFFSLVPLFVSLVAFFYVGLYSNHDMYNYLYLLPLSYFFCFVFFLKGNFKANASVFFIVFNLVVFFRYVILPILIVYSEYYGGRAMLMPNLFAFNTAHFIMIYELLLTTIVVNYFEKRKNNQIEKKLILPTSFGENLVFIAFVIFVLLFLFLKRDWLFAVNFFIANPLEVEVTGDTMLGSYLLILIKQILFVFAIYYFSIKYNKSKNFIYILLTFIAMALNIGIFVGTNRSDVLVPAIVSLLLVSKLFSYKTARSIVLVVFAGVFILISQITETRNFSSISGGKSDLVDRTDFLQVYLGGPYNVAIAVDMKESYPEAGELKVLFFDVVRPMIGVNFLVKDMDIKYSNIYYNHRIFKNENRSQIIPMIGQSSLFFGYIFSPFLSVLFVFLAYQLNRFVNKSSNAIIYYFLILSVARMGFLMGQNTMNMINDLSFNIYLLLIIYWLNKKIQI